jgi:metal-responsive CopG/Arc/MetJ family transcriptional regulator
MKSRNKSTERPNGKMVVTVVLEKNLLQKIDEKVSGLDMNRSQFIRSLVRKSLNDDAAQPA